ncbi:MAG TPA: tetraacyldisaccharide 4'-kinase [Chlamydiales bacterium]|jgi:tetraacyldisaccharide 4'-kinase
MLPLWFKFLSFGRKFLSSPFSRLLIPVSWIWALVATLRGRWTSTVQVNVPVVSVGNLTVGGSGKTPLVILLAQAFPMRKLAILSRGYGANAGALNDEMQVIARHLPNAMLYQGANRVQLAQQAVNDGAELILLDDGFQHRRLFRDFDLVIVRPEDWHERCLPSGSLREPVSALKRADFLFAYEPVPQQAIRLETKVIGANDYQGQKVGIFCGIGRPEKFRATIDSLGAKVVAELFLGDHEPISAQKLACFSAQCQRLGAKYLLCTEKDFVKLPSIAGLPVRCIEIEVVVKESVMDWQKLIAEIEQKLT